MIEPGPRLLRRRVRYDCRVRSAVQGGSSPHTTSTRRHTGTAVPADKASAASTAWHFAGPTSRGSPRSVSAPTSPSRRIRTCRVPVELALADSTVSQPARSDLSTRTSDGSRMKAIVQERFGPPDVLRLADADRPEPGAGEVLVRVHAAAVNPYDWHMLRGDPRIARRNGADQAEEPGGRDRRGGRGRGGRPGRGRAAARRRGARLLPGRVRRVRGRRGGPAGAQAHGPYLRAGCRGADGGDDRAARDPGRGRSAG